MTRLGREIERALRGVLPAALLLLALASPATAQTLFVQPDGKILLAGETYPEYGALARLQPDGSLDPSFGQGGFVIDQRTGRFTALAAQPDGRTVAAASRGAMVARYLPDGAADPSFGAGGLGGVADAVPFAGGGYAPRALLVRPDGSLVIGANTSLGGGGVEAWVNRYDAVGSRVEAVGRVPHLEGPADASYLNDLLESPAGSLFGVGSTYEAGKSQSRAYVARFAPGSGTNYDPGFAAAGLARLDSPSSFASVANAGDKLLAAGSVSGTILLARFDEDGALDPSFGEGGLAAPPIVGPGRRVSDGAGEEPRSGAGDLAVMPDGDVVLGGGTTQWSTAWSYVKMLGPQCADCPQPLLARFDESGKLDPSFGSGGILRLLRPDGGLLLANAEEVTALADGKLLVHGQLGRKPFVARLNPDGSYDPSFGAGGLAIVDFPCSGASEEELRPAGCVPSALVTPRLRGLRRGKPVLSLRMSPSLSWAAIGNVALTLPRGVRPTRKLKSTMRMTAIGGTGRGSVRVLKPKGSRGKTTLLFQGFGEARELVVKLRDGGLRTFGRQRLRRRSLRLRMSFSFTDTTFRDVKSYQTLVRRVRSTA